MNGEYGELSPYIIRLDENYENVRQVWNDGVARSYEGLNDNIKKCAERIWACYSRSVEGRDAVKKNYSETEVARDLSILAQKAEDA